MKSIPMFFEDGSEAPARDASKIQRGAFNWKVHRIGACSRCGGAGGHSHWPGFTCFKCGGHGQQEYVDSFKSYTAERLETLRRLETKRIERVKAKAEEAERLILEATADSRAALQPFLHVLLPMTRRAAEKDMGAGGLLSDAHFFLAAENPRHLAEWLSPKRLEVLLDIGRRLLAEEEAKASLPDLVEGRYELQGEVLGIKQSESQFGVVYKMTLKLKDGNKVYGTLPSAISEAERGDWVKLTAKVERSNDDTHFGFYSRPSKASIESALK